MSDAARSFSRRGAAERLTHFGGLTVEWRVQQQAGMAQGVRKENQADPPRSTAELRPGSGESRGCEPRAIAR